MTVLRTPAPGQDRENRQRRAAWARLILRVLTFVLLAATVSLSSGAKNSGYTSHHSPARYLSKITKMRETPVQRADTRQVLSRSSDSPPAVAAADPSPPVTTLILAASPTLSADQFRSPPASL